MEKCFVTKQDFDRVPSPELGISFGDKHFAKAKAYSNALFILTEVIPTNQFSAYQDNFRAHFNRHRSSGGTIHELRKTPVADLMRLPVGSLLFSEEDVKRDVNKPFDRQKAADETIKMITAVLEAERQNGKEITWTEALEIMVKTNKHKTLDIN
jgi:hypothetical protein